MESFNSKTARYLQKIGSITKNVYPEISKYYLSLSYINEDKTANEFKDCPQCVNCLNPLLPDKCKIRIYPRPTMSKQMLLLYKREQNQPWNLSTKDRKKLAKFKIQSNKIVYLCLNCKKTKKYSGSKLPKFPVSTASLPKVYFHPSSLKKKKNINSLTNGLTLNLESSKTLKSTEDSTTPVTKFKYSNSSFNNSSETKNEIPFSLNSRRSSLLKNTSDTPSIKSKKKNKNSLLHQLLLEETRKQQESFNNSLSAFLSSI